MAQVPPSESPAVAIDPGAVLALKFFRMKAGTVLVRYVSMAPNFVLLTHSESPNGDPLMSGMTRIGAIPWCCSAKASAVASANDARVQSAGAPGVPCIKMMIGSLGWVRPNHAGGTQM